MYIELNDKQSTLINMNYVKWARVFVKDENSASMKIRFIQNLEVIYIMYDSAEKARKDLQDMRDNTTSTINIVDYLIRSKYVLSIQKLNENMMRMKMIGDEVQDIEFNNPCKLDESMNTIKENINYYE